MKENGIVFDTKEDVHEQRSSSNKVLEKHMENHSEFSFDKVYDSLIFDKVLF